MLRVTASLGNHTDILYIQMLITPSQLIQQFHALPGNAEASVRCGANVLNKP